MSTFKELFQRYLDDQKLAPEEIRQLRIWIQEESNREQLEQMLASLYEEVNPEQLNAETNSRTAFEEVWSRLQYEATDSIPVTKHIPLHRRRWWYAAAAILLIGAGIPAAYYLLRNRQPVATVHNGGQPDNDILPGGNQAVLTLADGSTISLDKASNGVLSQQGATQVVKLANGELAYQASENTAASGNMFNIITTPRGGKYQVTLPDGTRVWLNAASTLRYPAAFTGPVREVMLTGEAYFEVSQLPIANKTAQKRKLPFRVAVSYRAAGGETRQGIVEALGTHFNVNAYEEEAVIKTTLLEGSVRVSTANERADSRVLKPGQQAQIAQQQLSVITDADTEAAIAWKNGLIQFEGNDIYAAMRMIARNYDVTVEYRGAAPATHFRGAVSSNGPVSGVLHMMEQTGEVHFEIEGRKIIVKP